MDDLQPFAVLGQKENERRRINMIERQRQQRREVEWAHKVIEWAWFASASIFMLGMIAGAIFWNVARG
jgi:hypothetical protein